MFRFKKCARARVLPVIKTSGKKNATLRRLRSFLAVEEPQTVMWLVNLWNEQQAAITYSQLGEMIVTWDVSNELLEKWQKSYSKMVNTKLAPQWTKAMDAAAEELKKQFPHFLYDPSVGAAQEYIRLRGAELVTNLVAEQRRALRAMIAQAAHYDAMTPDSLSRMMRPVIGLTKPQAVANLNYWAAAWEAGAEAGLSKKAIEERAMRMAATYAEKQHRYRAMNIARTELAMAYGRGAYEATVSAQEQGYIGDCVKIWISAEDERTCTSCHAVDGERVNMNALFSNGAFVNPAHPSCRCAVAYEEVAEAVAPVTTPPDVATQATPDQQNLQSGTGSGMLSDEEARLNDFKVQLDTLLVMSDDYKKALIERFKAGNEDAQRAYIKHVKADSVADNANRKAYFDPATGKIYMNYQRDLNDRRGAGNTFFHENGHYLDWNSRASKTDPIRSRKTPDFGQAIRDDLKALEANAKNLYGVKRKADVYDKIMEDMLSQYTREDLNGISDIIEGVTKIAYPMGYGHGIKYWKSMPVEVEAFAHLYAAQFDERKLQAMRQYLPKATAEYERIQKGLI